VLVGLVVEEMRDTSRYLGFEVLGSRFRVQDFEFRAEEIGNSGCGLWHRQLSRCLWLWNGGWDHGIRGFGLKVRCLMVRGWGLRRYGVRGCFLGLGAWVLGV